MKKSRRACAPRNFPGFPRKTAWLAAAFALPLAAGCASAPAFPTDLASCVATQSPAADQARINQEEEPLARLKVRLAYPEIASVQKLHLPKGPPQKVVPNAALSPGLADPLLEQARRVAAFDDFKPLSDLRPKKLDAAGRAAAVATATKAAQAAKPGIECRKAFLHAYIDEAYDSLGEITPVQGLVSVEWKLKGGTPALSDAFDYTERTLAKLIRKTPPHSDGSLLPTPYPIAIPAGRFQEAYYWDTYFGMLGLIATDRLELARMLVENFLEAVRDFGFVPNGMRDYYLSRSQPPFLSSMVHDVYVASLKGAGPKTRQKLRSWLAKRAYPLLRRDYENFWMAAGTRFDPETGLNHHWDALDLPRPERHATDDETKIGRTFRDVRAESESGLDFTVAFDGDCTHVADVLLNGMLYKTELDLAWAAKESGAADDAGRFEAAAAKRRKAMDQYLWDPARGVYENYDLRTKARIPVLSAAAFVPLYVHAASPEQAEGMRKALEILEKKGGLLSSEAMDSSFQWDGANGWAPLQVMAVQGLRGYGFDDDAKRIAGKWVNLIADVHHQMHAMYERMDVLNGAQAYADGKKYPPQEGFLWTNSSYVWMLKDVLGYSLARVQP